MQRTLIFSFFASLALTAFSDSTHLNLIDSKIHSQMQMKALSFANSINVKNTYSHLEEFMTIASRNENNRSAGTKGYDDSALYVAQTLLYAGYSVRLFPFEFKEFNKVSAPVVSYQTNEEAAPLVEGTDFDLLAYSASGIVTAPIAGVDLQLGPENQTTSGCEPEDFANFPAGHIAFIQRGTCTFQAKAENAAKAGALAVVIFNQGNSADREGLFSGSLTGEYAGEIAVIGMPTAIALRLLETNDLLLSMNVQTKVDVKTTHNVIADSKYGNPDNLVVLGSHLDSVHDGPGINDNGSGSAGLLEVALQLASVKTNNQLRFAWWGAEELGLVGSRKYVESLSESEKAKIALYLNFDMIGSTNYVFGVFDGDGSTHGTAGPAGSAAIEQLYNLYFASTGVSPTAVALSGRTDYVAFAEAGLPVGGLFTGAEGTKSKEEVKNYGGVENAPYDPCYHQSCDNLENISLKALEQNVKAIAFTALSFGYSTAPVDQQKEQAKRDSKALSAINSKTRNQSERVYHLDRFGVVSEQ